MGKRLSQSCVANGGRFGTSTVHHSTFLPSLLGHAWTKSSKDMSHEEAKGRFKRGQCQLGVPPFSLCLRSLVCPHLRLGPSPVQKPKPNRVFELRLGALKPKAARGISPTAAIAHARARAVRAPERILLSEHSVTIGSVHHGLPALRSQDWNQHLCMSSHLQTSTSHCAHFTFGLCQKKTGENRV